MSNEDNKLYEALLATGHTEAQAQGLIALHKDNNNSTDLRHLLNTNTNVIEVEATKK
jgi:hypothetical protein